MTKLICGVGYNSKREHKTKINGIITVAYDKWRSMIQRCYDARFQKNNPAYIGCSVVNEWHDYQVFADWFYGNAYGELGYQLDKDLLAPNNKIYSPETCCFVPSELNKMLTDRKSCRGKYPQGVSLRVDRGMYSASIKINGVSKTLGLFDCPDKAHQVYKKAKEDYVKVKALEWQHEIDERVFKALMKWKLTA